MFPGLTLTLHKTIQGMQILNKWKIKFTAISFHFYKTELHCL